jgi:nitroreductase
MTNFSDEDIDVSLSLTTEARGLPADALKGYGDFMKSKIGALSEDVRNTWTSKQTYLALGNLLNAAAELRIDVTPIEGFEPDKVNEILGLKQLGLNASVLATIGYRHKDDATQNYVKVRKSNEELFINL